MKYIDTSSGYLLEDYKDIVKINENDVNNFKFERKHLALIKGLVFKAGSDEDLPKKYTAEMSKLVLADTDLNILTNFMIYGMYKTIDLTGIIRSSEIDPMYNLILKNNPKDLRHKKGNVFTSLFSKSEEVECCILFVNYETRERIFEHVIYNDDQNDKFFMDYSNKDFFPALILKKDEIEKTFKDFNKIEKKEVKLDFTDNIFINPRNLYGENIKEEEIKQITDPLYKLEKNWEDNKRDSLNDKELLNELKNEDKSIDAFLEELKDTTINAFINHLKNKNVKYERDVLPEKTLDFITFARNDKEKMKKTFELIADTNKKYSNLICNEHIHKQLKIKLK